MQAIIIGFLIGAVASLAVRVWALIPLTLIIFLGTACFHLHQGLPALSALGDGVLVALAPQMGYAFGLSIAGVVLTLRSPRESSPGRFASRNPPGGA